MPDADSSRPKLTVVGCCFFFITSRWQCATLKLNKSAYWGSSREDLDEQNRSQAWAVGFSLLLFFLCDLLLHVCVYHCSCSFLCRSPFCWQLINNAGTTPVSVWSGSVPAPVGPGRGGSPTSLPVLSLNSPERRKVTSYFQGTIESQLRRTTLFDLKHSPTLRFRCTDVVFFCTTYILSLLCMLQTWVSCRTTTHSCAVFVRPLGTEPGRNSDPETRSSVCNKPSRWDLECVACVCVCCRSFMELCLCQLCKP